MPRSARPTYVLGTGLSHDGSACLLKDGVICAAIEKERITRLKHDGGNDAAAVSYCLAAAGIGIDDVDLVVQNANFGMLQHGHDWWGGPRVLPVDAPVMSISHHLAHAYSAIGTSPFDDAAVLVIDGCGNAYDECIDLAGAIVPDPPASPDLAQLSFEKDSYYQFGRGALTTIHKDFSPWGIANRNYPMLPPTTKHSLGGLYLAASMYVFNGFEDPGKLMGLAPYGRPGVYDFEIFDLRDGRAFVRYDWMEQFTRPARTPEEFKANFSYYADIAWWVQKELERAILYIVRSRYELSPARNLAYAGGVALNAVANAKVLTGSPFERVYIQPAAADNGLAIGCAYYGWMEVLKRERPRHDGRTCFGRGYDRAALDDALENYADRVDVMPSADVVEETAAALASGLVVGWFQDGAEFGPRALGHRSILADPRRPDVRRFINAEIKQREDFRPFAPSVPAEAVSRYFDCDYESPYMILVAPVRPECAALIPSVVHEDGSARIQTVTADSDQRYHSLLWRFGAHSGVPILLNTSFNKRRMPIVETPAEALALFTASALDLLVIGDYVVRKAAVPRRPAWELTRFFGEDMPRALEGEPLDAARGAVFHIAVATTRGWTIDLSGNLSGRPAVSEGAPPRPADLAIALSEADLRVLLRDPIGEGLRLLQTSSIQVEGDRRRLQALAQLLIRAMAGPAATAATSASSR